MTSTLTFDVSDYESGERFPRHHHDELHLSLVLRGTVRETVGSATEYARPLSVVLKNPGVDHADEFGSDGAKLARLCFLTGELKDLVDDPSRCADWRWTHDATVARCFFRMVQRAASGDVREFDDSDPDVVDLIAAFTARPEQKRSGFPPRWLEEIVTEIRATWNPSMNVSAVARRAGVHPVYLARCMRRWFGVGVAEELRRLRMASAALDLSRSRSTVSSIAHRHGFSDEAHLARDFRRTLGVTTRRYRTVVQALK